MKTNMRRLHGRDKRRRDKAIRDYEYQYCQMSEAEIGKAFGVSQPTVSRALNPPTNKEAITIGMEKK